MSNDVKKFYRSTTERMLGGVCGGLGKYLGMDPTVVRLLFILFGFMGGSALLVYIIMLIVVPEEPLQFTDPTEDSIVEA